MLFPLHKISKLVFFTALFLVMAAFFTTAFPLEPKYRHVSAIFVVLFALPCYYGLFKSFGIKNCLILISVMSLFALLLENFAITTGLPYGTFEYNALIGDTIGKVPWTVGLAWTPILFGAWAMTQKLLPNVKMWQQYVFSALLMTALDTVIDPGSVALGFWRWENSIGFYGVPWSNYFGWLLTSFIGTFLLSHLLKRLKVSSRHFSSWSYSSYFLMLAYWISVCFFLQLWMAFIIASVIAIALAHYLLQSHTAN